MDPQESNHEIIQQLAALDESGGFEWLKKKTEPLLKLMTYYRCAIMEVETKFNVLNEEYAFAYDRNPINSIKSRLKRFRSISEKLERKDLPLTMESVEENLNDIAGVRVICSFPEDVYTLAEAFLKQDDVRLIRKKDYIANPKENGYRSLHLIIAIPVFLANERREMKVEVQLRTIAMDFWASLEHQMHYKKDIDLTDEMEQELLECAQISAALDVRMDQLRKRIKQQN